MLFQSIEFIYIFIFIALFVYVVLSIHCSRIFSKIWIVAASLAFYAWWYPPNLILILLSMGGNFALGTVVGRPAGAKASNQKIFLVCGVALNLAALAYYKYTPFILENASLVSGVEYSFSTIVLPLAISFFTFQQIAFLVDRYRDHIEMPSLIDYLFFVTFFPQLIAGPIVLAREIFPQLDDVRWNKPQWLDFSVGLTLFTMGVFKKVFFGDAFGEIANHTFSAASMEPQDLVISWAGVLAFSLQIYFDFSGYSDMAVGLGRMMGINIPFNFNSPYKAVSIIDFWRRWHITLSRFLKDYLYIPLGGNRKGPIRRYVNLGLVMLIGGLWHGAGWAFVIWGGIHGISLIINHLWRTWRERAMAATAIRGEHVISWALTTVVVTFAWIFFRSGDVSTATNIMIGMTGATGILALPSHYAQYFGSLASYIGGMGVDFNYSDKTIYFNDLKSYLLIPIGYAFVFILPNTQSYLCEYLKCERVGTSQIIRFFPVFVKNAVYALRWKPNVIWGLAYASLLIWLTLQMNTIKSFVYFEF